MIPRETQKLIKYVLKPFQDHGLISVEAWSELLEKLADDSEKPRKPMLLMSQDVAEILKLSIRTVHRMVEDGDLPSYKITGKRALRFKLEDVEKLIEDGRVTSEIPHV